MFQKNSNPNTCPSWTPQEIEDLRRSLQASDIAPVDTAMFGKRFSEILLRGWNTKKVSRANEKSLPHESVRSTAATSQLG
jgi:hypothetical protein